MVADTCDFVLVYAVRSQRLWAFVSWCKCLRSASSFTLTTLVGSLYYLPHFTDTERSLDQPKVPSQRVPKLADTVGSWRHSRLLSMAASF